MRDDALNRTKVLRGSSLPNSKLDEHDVMLIRQLIRDRNYMREQIEKLREQIRQLSNSKIAEKFDVHIRTIDRISAGESWCHVED